MPSVVELVYDQVGISIDRHSSWRARTQVLQDVEDAGIFSHVVGHILAAANQAALSQENTAIFILDDDSKAGGSSWIDRLAGTIEPGKDSWLL